MGRLGRCKAGAERRGSGPGTRPEPEGTTTLPLTPMRMLERLDDLEVLQTPTAGRATSLRWAQLVAGLLGCGAAIPLMIRSHLGLGPWDAFHVGIYNLTGISVGAASIAVGAAIVAGSYFLGIRPGAGTVANMVLIGVFIDLILPLIPDATSVAQGFGYYAVGIILMGLSSGMYMGAGLGNGPRDSLMLGLSTSWNWPVRRVRTVIELSALGGGWAMGGTIGIGTLLFALTIGPAAQWGLQLFDALPPPSGPRPARSGAA